MNDSELGQLDLPEDDERRVEWSRRLSPGQRAAISRAMTEKAVKTERQAIAREHPEWSEFEVKLHWAEIHYGKELIDRVRAYLVSTSKLVSGRRCND
jgi:hypothetical protein